MSDTIQELFSPEPFSRVTVYNPKTWMDYGPEDCPVPVDCKNTIIFEQPGVYIINHSRSDKNESYKTLMAGESSEKIKAVILYPYSTKTLTRIPNTLQLKVSGCKRVKLINGFD